MTLPTLLLYNPVMTNLTDKTAWKALEAYYARLPSVDSPRALLGCKAVAGLSVDYTYNHLTDKSLQLFAKLVDACDLSHAICQLFAGKIVNNSEQRAAWHTLLRDKAKQPRAVNACFAKMRHWASVAPQQGFTDIIHIGIGGSYLGPVLLYDVFSTQFNRKISCHFIANQNTDTLESLLRGLNPNSTLVIVVSKSFTTFEILASASQVIDWLTEALPHGWRQQLVAVTANKRGALELGVLPGNIFPLWDWIGGRFSVWSAVSLSVVLSFGWQPFESFLEGAYQVDQHYRQQKFVDNVPILLACLAVLYRHFFNAQTQAIVPYHEALTHLPAYLQQLHMESLGKQVTAQGQPVTYPTGAVIWGGVAPGSEHSFFQLLLQGNLCVPIDFIAVRNDEACYLNCRAHASILMKGYQGRLVLPHQRIAGNQPSILISMEELTPENLGSLLALYEHKVFTQAIIWNINPFDQWGVQVGKQLKKLFINSI